MWQINTNTNDTAMEIFSGLQILVIDLQLLKFFSCWVSCGDNVKKGSHFLCYANSTQISTYILWFNSILSLNFIFFGFKLIIIHYHNPKQRKLKFKSRIKLNHNISIHIPTKHVHPHISEIMGHSISL